MEVVSFPILLRLFTEWTYRFALWKATIWLTKETLLKPFLRKMTLALAMAAGTGSAQAGVLTYQDVVFTTNWSNNVLTLEIDAAIRSGNWATPPCSAPGA